MKVTDKILGVDFDGQFDSFAEQKGIYETVSMNPFVLTVGKFRPGQADKYYENILDENRKNICRAELLYYRGDPAAARSAAEKLAESRNIGDHFARMLIDAITALSMGESEKIMNIYRMLKSARSLTDRFPQFKTTVDFFGLYFHILIHNKEDIIFPEIGIDAFKVPDELKPMAIYAYAHYLNICGDYNHSIGLAESALILSGNSNPISEIYLALIACIGYISRGDHKRAEYFFRYAWELAGPDKIIMPFVELRGLLSGILEKVLKKDYHEDYRTISELSAVYHENWIKVHNDITGETVSDILTPSEFNVAMLASKGFCNDEIADFLGISVNSVRAHLRNIFIKLDIESRKDLYRFVIK